MSVRIWEGRCEDCYEKKPLEVCSDHRIIPAELSAELCGECISRRKALGDKGPSMPIGLILHESWQDLKTLQMVVAGKVITVFVKYYPSDQHGGLVRLRVDGQPKWLAGGAFGSTPQRAEMEAKHFLRTVYFLGGPVEFL